MHLEGSTRLLDDVYALQVAAAFQPQHSIHSQLCKVLLVLGQDLGAESSDQLVKFGKGGY